MRVSFTFTRVEFSSSYTYINSSRAHTTQHPTAIPVYNISDAEIIFKYLNYWIHMYLDSYMELSYYGLIMICRLKRATN